MPLTIKLSAPAPPILRFGAVTVSHVEGDIYDGEYTVIPNFETQTLETRAKTMLDDVSVEPIPVSRTDNPAGGKTIYIGGIING